MRHKSDNAVDILRIVRRRRRLFRDVSLAVATLLLAVDAALPARYSTAAVVMIEPRKNTLNDQTSVLSETPTDPASIQDQIQVLTSRELAEHVVEKLGLDRDPEFSSPVGQVSLDPRSWLGLGRSADAEAREDAVVSAFVRHLSVEAIGLSTTISVTFSSRDPEKAALIADTIVASYLDAQAAVRFDVTQRTTDWLLARIRQLGQQEQVAEANVQRYKAENHLNDTPVGSVVDQQLAAINAQLVAAREALAAKQAETERISALLREGHMADVSQIISSPLIVELREQEAQVIRDEAQLTARYGPKHPKMLAAESQKRDLDTKIAEEVARLAGSLENETSVARAQVHSLEESLQRAESESTSENMARIKLQALEANAASTRTMYEAFVTRLRETQGQDALQLLDARVISQAPVPTAPSWPPRLLIAAAAIPFGVLFGLFAVLLAERFGGPAEQSDLRGFPAEGRTQPQMWLGSPVLARIPSADAGRLPELVAEHPASPSAESLRHLAGKLSGNGRAVIVAVTSVDPREGQTSVALGFVRAASGIGRRVILFDGNLAAPRAALRAGLPPAPAALTQALAGTARLAEIWQRDSRSNAFVISGPPQHTKDVWLSVSAQRLTNYLRQVCDLVVVDAPPIMPGNELAHIARLADAIIVVAGSSGAPRPGLSAALEYLRSTSDRPSGLILTV